MAGGALRVGDGLSFDPDEEGALGPMAEINVTPLVDVMLVLLIIFMVTAPLMMVQLPVELPKASLQEVGKPKEPLVVGVDAAGLYYIMKEQVPADQLMPRLKRFVDEDPDQVVYVSADKTVPYGQVMQLLSFCGVAGFYKISLMAESPNS
jgi:biopolymer transport protein TolR